MRATALLAASMATACSLFEGGVPAGAVPESGLDAPEEERATNDAAYEAEASVPDVVLDVVPEACDPDTCPGRRCSSGVCDFWADCNDLHTNVPNATDGVYAFKSYSAWCDMTKESGGWTLVGRSVAFGSLAYGWKSPRGAPNDDTKPYVLDLSVASLAYTEGLIGSYSSGKTWSTLYRFSFPPNFPNGFDTKAAAVKNGTLVTSAHGCQTYPTMLNNVGWVNHTELFFFRDNGSDSFIFGLTPTGFSLNDPVNTNCAYSGKINGEQGMLMVR